jgi:hypothetical protein
MATLMDMIMGEYRGATPQSREANAGRLSTAMSQAGMGPVVSPAQASMSPEELAYSIANPDITRRPAAEATGPMRAPSFQRLMQAGAMSQAINPARAAMGEQALAQARSGMAIRQGFGGVDEVGFQYRPSNATQPAPPMVDEVGFQYRPSMAQPAVPGMTIPQGGGNLPFFAQGQTMPTSPLSIGAMGGQGIMGSFPPSFASAEAPTAAPMATAPMPPRIPGGQTRGVREPGFFERLFAGPQYQSNNMLVNMMPQGPMADTGAPMPQYINYGDPNNAADFFRADQALMQQNPSFFGLLGGSNG